MDKQFRISYVLTVDDNLIYQEKVFLSNKNPSIIDSIRRWIRFSFLLIVVLYPVFTFMVTNSVKITAVITVAALVLFGLLWMNATKLYWKRYRLKAKKDMVKLFFENDVEKQVPIEAAFSEEELTIISEDRTKTIRKSDINLIEITEKYIFFYTTKYDGSIIPLKRLVNEQQVIDWFS
ncbi:YcxB family protein [uncultured Enterococcus sp.]|uniref:YcxB family protein n=1 Tax=uncultured Enterococcus sp. TaxID=167972 RepID=UPI002AA9323A|nr:YcxB family protein [uncultured Enterococcus sp.]